MSRMDSPTSKGAKSPLHRGEACLTCRRRKMKCDAGKPACSPCLRAGKADECEYDEAKYEALVQKLQERIRDLELEVAQLKMQIPQSPSTVASPSSPPAFQSFLEPPSPSFALGTSGLPFGAFSADARSPSQLAATVDLSSRANSPRGHHSDSSGSAGSSHSPFIRTSNPMPYTAPLGTPLSASPGNTFPYDLPSGPYHDPMPIAIHSQDMEWGPLSYLPHSGGTADLVAPFDFSPDHIQKLIDIFIPHRRQCGLETTSPLSSPHPALLYAMCLWGIHFSANPSFLRLQGQCYSRAVSEVQKSLASTPDKHAHLIQALCLLALHSFVHQRTVEGYYQAAGAMRLAVAFGFHQLPWNSWRPPGARLAEGMAPPSPHSPHPVAPPLSPEEERLLVFWQVFNLDRVWATVNSLPPALQDSNDAQAQVTTQFPPNLTDDYYNVNVEFALYPLSVLVKDSSVKPRSSFPFLFQGSVRTPISPRAPLGPNPASLRDLYSGPDFSFEDGTETLFSLRAKGCALFQRASALATTYHTHGSQSNPAFWGDFQVVSGAVDKFISVLPSHAASDRSSAAYFHQQPHQPENDLPTWIAVRTLGYTTSIRLHALFVENSAERDKCLANAKHVAAVIGMVDAESFQLLEPILGICWVQVALFLQRVLYDHEERPPTPRFAQRKRMIWNDLKIIMDAVKRLSVMYPFLNEHFAPQEQGHHSPITP